MTDDDCREAKQRSFQWQNGLRFDVHQNDQIHSQAFWNVLYVFRQPLRNPRKIEIASVDGRHHACQGASRLTPLAVSGIGSGSWITLLEDDEMIAAIVTSSWTTLAIVGYRESVAESPRDQNRAAHGGVCLLQVRRNAAGLRIGRRVNSNGGEREYGKAFPLYPQTLAQWEIIAYDAARR